MSVLIVSSRLAVVDSGRLCRMYKKRINGETPVPKNKPSDDIEVHGSCYDPRIIHGLFINIYLLDN